MTPALVKGAGKTSHIKASSATLTTSEMNGGVINNYGQAAADVTLTAEAITDLRKFSVHLGTAQAANFWMIDFAALNPVYLDGVVTTAGKIKIAAPTVGASLACESFQTGASQWSINCYSGNGLFVDGGA